ncbi:GON-4-like protein isoform X2 [Gopherus flavomarginatus]|uniref:GON-4-like protein isoform X2 n=1 Tax=Gopherus flavomarginatus TaxID=286002 RepID=UPI0021CC119C|nr:GON-4-like protein isoform X2 [Gopherus flavomarginatus]
MSHSLKMLPCKKRRAVAVEPRSPSVDLSYHKECAALLSDAESVKLESSNPSGAEELRDSVSRHWRVSKITDTQPASAVKKTGAQPVCSVSTAIILDKELPFLETTDGGVSKGNIIPGKGTSQVCSQRAWKEPVENFLRSGERIPMKCRSDLSQDSGEGQLNTKETAMATEFLEQGKEQEFTKEGKSPKLHTGVEVILQRHPHPSDNHSPKQLAQVKSSLLLPIKAPAMIKTSKNTKTGEQLQQTDEETEDVGLFIPLEEQDLEEGERRKRRRKATKRKREERCQEEEASLACDIKLDDMLDRTLEDGAKQHNLTVVNVRNILHEVITNEHVVAMMKAAISETEDMPMFEPKMTRSKLKEVVEKGVVIPAWNISPIKKANEIKPPQFVDIPLEDDDSSDEEYQPEDEDEDETAEESLLESDVESTTSSPRGAKRSRTRRSSDMIETDEEGATLSEVEKVSTPLIRHISAEVVPMGPPPPPKPKQSRDSTFMEKLHAVDEELASSPVCMDSYQSLDDSLIAFRTRSKRPLKDVPLGQLEAELRAPDITPDMYDPNTADDEDWKRWLGGLMNDDVESEDEADDDDDPEYNFLEDLDEPDTEDFRNDRAVRITKKEVNELMEELFETDEMGFSNMEDEGQEDEDTVAESRPNFNTPQALRFEEPLANLLNEQHRTVKEQLEQLRIKKSSTKQPQEMEGSKPQIEKPLQTLVLDMGQRKRLHQQMQQHVQLLTQIHLLTSSNSSLSSEASTTRMFLTELSNFAHSSMLLRQQFHPKFQTEFQPCNLKGALQLIEDFHAQVKVDWSPRKTVKKSANEFPCIPKQVAWILATRKVFMYPELLPICSLKAKAPQNKIIFTKAEDKIFFPFSLLALGLKHFEGTEFPKPLISKYLLPAKTAHQLTVRIKNLNMNRAPDNIIRYYKRTKQLPILFKCCEEIQPSECKPPVEREEQHLPFWLKASLSSLQRELKQLAEDAGEAAGSPSTESALLRTEKETLESQCDEKYPLLMPKGIVLTLKPLANRFSRRAWRRQGSAALKPLLIRPSPCLQPSANTINIQKAAVKLPQSEAPPNKVVVQIPRLIQPATIMQTIPGMQHLNIPSAVGSGDCFEFQSVLSTLQSDSRTSLPAAIPPALVSSTPVTFQTKMMPALTASKIRKPCVRRGYQKKKGTKSTPLIKAAPLIHPAPVIFTVPAATVKVVSIGNGCNMIQPINTTVGSGTQAIPITTLLVNPTTFPCPLNQPLVSSSIPPLIASPNSVGLPASSTAEEKEKLNLVTSRLAVNDENSFPIAEPKVEPRELYSSCSAISPKKEHSTGPATPDNDSQEKVKESECYSWIVVETMEKAALEPLPVDLLPHLEDLGETVKTEPEDSSDALEEENPTQEKKNLNAEIKEEFILDLGQELDMEVPSEHLSEQKEIKKECTSHQEKGREVEAPTQDEQQLEDIDTAGMEMSHETSKNASHSTDVDAEFSSPLGKPEDSSSVDGQSVGTPAGPEAVGEKDGQEEEEEEDFDDFTQDADDISSSSSSSEESVLSVPELQETMEKLTWLATERHLSQEGDSEEENSQEENSEPEEEEEEEGEGEGMESLQKDDEMTDEIAEDLAEEPKSAFIFTKVAPEVETNRMPPDENVKVPGKNRNSHRARNKRGRTRASKDTSKLLLLYDEEILERDPLREQKDLAFAQAYLNRVREALRNVPGKYEDFLRVIYEFETSTHKPTAVDLYSTLQTLLQEWPQLLTDFAAFLLPEQALECGLFEEQQAFDKSRKFLRQLEICFAENPTHHQKIIKVLQSCADCLPQDIAELKTQMWQLLKGHDHLQDEFSIFFDHLRPSASRMGDFEEINWTEEKEYEFDGFEEVSLPDVEEEEETPKMHTASKNKKRKEIGGQNNDKEMEWVDGVKEFSCSCHEGSSDPKLKKSKRRTCSHSSCKVCDSKSYKNKDSQELTNSLTQRELSPQPEEKELGTCKEPAEESLEYRDEEENGQSRTKNMSRKADSLASGSQLEGQLICCRGVSSEGGLPNSRVLELSSTGSPLCSAKARVTAVVDTAKESQTGIADSGFNIKLPQQNKSNPYGLGSYSETRLNQRQGGTGEGSLGLAKHILGSDSAARTGCMGADHFPGRSLQQNVALKFKSSVKPGHAPSKSGGREMERLSFPLKGKPEVKRNWLGAVRKLRLKILDKSSHLQVPSDRILSEADGTGCIGVSPFDQESQSRLKSNKSNCCFEVPQQSEELGCRAVPSDMGQREDEQQQKIMEATVCAKNSKVSSTGEKVVLWTREADRVILTTCQERGAHLETFSAISQELGNKTASEVSHRFRELMRLFHTSYDGSSEDDEDATSTSNTDQLSDKDLLLSEEEQDE